MVGVYLPFLEMPQEIRELHANINSKLLESIESLLIKSYNAGHAAGHKDALTPKPIEEAPEHKPVFGYKWMEEHQAWAHSGFREKQEHLNGGFTTHYLLLLEPPSIAPTP